MFITSDTPDISDWEGIAEGFPCRDMVKDRVNSNSPNNTKQDHITFNPGTTNDSIKLEILDENSNEDTATLECLISINPAKLEETPPAV